MTYAPEHPLGHSSPPLPDKVGAVPAFAHNGALMLTPLEGNADGGTPRPGPFDSKAGGDWDGGGGSH